MHISRDNTYAIFRSAKRPRAVVVHYRNMHRAMQQEDHHDVIRTALLILFLRTQIQRTRLFVFITRVQRVCHK